MKKGIALRTVKKTAEELLNTIKVAIYIRVSTHWQVDKESLPVQRQDLISYCKAHPEHGQLCHLRGPGILCQEHRPTGLPADDGPCQDRGVHAHTGLED